MGQVETMQIIEGILYKQDGTVVSVKPEDKRYRDAYRRMQRRVYGPLEIWAPDGMYTFDGRQMSPIAVG